jgi:hypothetical protein
MTSQYSKGRAAIAKTGLIMVVAALLFSLSEPSAAARKSRKPVDKASTQHSDQTRGPAYDPQGTSRYPYGPGKNFPYPDRPYGDPGRW